MFPCLPSPLCSIALCGLMLLKLHRVRSCVVGFGSWDTDNTWIIGSDVFIIHSERVNIWCAFLDVSESICKLRAASFHWLQWQPGLRLRLPFLERVLQWSIMSTGIGNGSCMCDEGQGLMESSSHRFLSKGRGEWVFLDPLCVLCRISAWLWGQMFLDCWAQTQGGGCVNKRVSAVTVLMQCLVGLHGLSGKQAALAWHSGYVSPKCQTDVVMLLARLSLACWELPWVSAQPHTADTYPGDIDRFQQPCPCMVQRKESTTPLPRHVVGLAQRSWSQDKWSGFTLKLCSREVHLHLVDQNLGPAYTPSHFAPCIPQFTGGVLQVLFRQPAGECMTFSLLPPPGSQSFLADRCRVGCTSASPPRCLQGAEGRFLPRKEMCSVSSCWTFLSGTGTHRHKMLNSGSSEVLRMFYKAICVWLNKPACTWPALAAVHQRDVRMAEGRRELGGFSLDCYLGDSVGLGKPVASKVIDEHLFFWCCHK